MKRNPELDAERALCIARLIDAEDSAARDRVLLEAALTLSAGIAAALWMHGPQGWRCLLERGEAGALPRISMIAALLAGDLGGDVLPSGQLLVRTGASSGDLALVLGGAALPETRDVLDALLRLRLLIEASDKPDASRPHPPYRSTPPRGDPGGLLAD